MNTIIFAFGCVAALVGICIFYKCVAWLDIEEPLSEHRRRVLDPAGARAEQMRRDLAVLRHKIAEAREQAKP